MGLWGCAADDLVRLKVDKPPLLKNGQIGIHKPCVMIMKEFGRLKTPCKFKKRYMSIDIWTFFCSIKSGLNSSFCWVTSTKYINPKIVRMEIPLLSTSQLRWIILRWRRKGTTRAANVTSIPNIPLWTSWNKIVLEQNGRELTLPKLRGYCCQA